VLLFGLEVLVETPVFFKFKSFFSYKPQVTMGLKHFEHPIVIREFLKSRIQPHSRETPLVQWRTLWTHNPSHGPWTWVQIILIILQVFENSVNKGVQRSLCYLRAHSRVWMCSMLYKAFCLVYHGSHPNNRKH